MKEIKEKKQKTKQCDHDKVTVGPAAGPQAVGSAGEGPLSAARVRVGVRNSTHVSPPSFYI